MAGFPGRKRPFSLALLTGFVESLVAESAAPPRSARSFVDGGAVGLRIVAAMTEVAGLGGARECRRQARTAGARSDPIPIVPARVLPERRAAPEGDEGEEEEEDEEEDEEEEDEEELSESYTCVITHEGGGCVRRRVYVDADGNDGADDIFGENSGAFFHCSLPPSQAPVDLWSRCRRCAQRLHAGIDRCQHPREKSDEHKDVCSDFSDPPFSKHLFFVPGVVAA